LDSSRYYDHNAKAFVAKTADIDMSMHRVRFLASLPQGATILDAGCGAGRDALAFQQAGYRVEAFDASAQMVATTRALTGIRVRQMRFEDFTWDGEFDGIWACASLLHVARADLTKVMRRLARILRPKGVIYASFKHGNEERQKYGRYFNDMTPTLLASTLDATPELAQSDIWISADQRPDRLADEWLNVLIGKTACGAEFG